MISFTTGPMGEPDWEDVTAYVRADEGIVIRRGRSSEFDRIEAGTLSLVLDNRDGRFDPMNEDGPYYGNHFMMRRITVGCPNEYYEYLDPPVPYTVPLFTGFIERWTPRYDGLDAVVEVEAVDGLKWLAMKRVTMAVPQESTGKRIERLLLEAGWAPGAAFFLDESRLEQDAYLAPVGGTQIWHGDTLMIDDDLEDVSVLEHIQQAVEAEQGVFFISAGGDATFIGRRYMFWHTSITDYVFSNNDRDPYFFSGIELEYDDNRIYNEVVTSAIDGEEFVAADGWSQAQFGTRTLTLTGLPLVNDEDAYQFGQYLCKRYLVPVVRISRLTFTGQRERWWAIISADIARECFVHYYPFGGRDRQSFCQRIEGVEHRITPTDWETTLMLSPFDPKTYWWLEWGGLFYSEYSVLEQTTRLAL